MGKPAYHLGNAGGRAFQIRVNVGQFAVRCERVEMAIEGDLIAHLGLAVVDPRIGNMRAHFAVKISVNIFAQRHGFVIAQFRIGIGIALAVGANVGGFIALAQGVADRLLLGCGEVHPRLCESVCEQARERVAVFVRLRVVQRGENREHAPLLFFGQADKSGRGFENGEAVIADLEIELEGPLDSDALVPK